ncbi:hypothetical protein LLEC1_03488 [Akanthomyces lecanii]|uniref:Uncharacterized protein n=1 Tax=Cordyceps confragosa TaxID=2714763 RepID=A0A179IJP9_CORDF|nr:hypothetical protein LLEC1_03488 [Akanthomyces lecanii]
MAPDSTAIANQAGADLDTYQAKTGFENRGAQVTQNDELSTNGSFNKLIPPSEGRRPRRQRKTCEKFDDTEGLLDRFNQPSRHIAINDGDVVSA